jgi:hypothetical protein
MSRQKIVLLVTAIFAFSETTQACEPILPFIKVVGGPAMLANSWIILLAAIAVKSIIFSALQQRLSRARAVWFMIAGNILTTFIGVLAAILIGSGPIMLIGALIVWPLCLMPARRLLAGVKSPWLDRFTPGSFATVMVLAMAVSCFIFGISSAFADPRHLILYWILKLTAVYVALIVSIILTAFWEEWVIWKLSQCPADYVGYVQPVIRANLAVLLCVMLLAAGVTLPQRLKSPDFLVKLGLVHGHTGRENLASAAAQKAPEDWRTP